MYDVDKLEKEWQQYKTNQRKRWSLFFLIILVVLSGLIYRREIVKIVSPQSVDRNRTVNNQKIEANATTLKPFVPTLDTNEDMNTTIDTQQLMTANRVESNQSVDSNESTPHAIEMIDTEEVEEVEPVHKRKYLKIEVTDMYPAKKQKPSK